jgi:hypothetical protein
MTAGGARTTRYRGEQGQAALLLLGLMAVLLVGALFLGSWGMALGARGKHQRAADLAAVSAARAMADAYPRLFEPPLLPDGAPNPRYLSLAAYERLGREAALQVGRRNGVPLSAADVRFPRSFAPTRVTVVARGAARLRVRGSHRRAGRIPLRARASAELAPGGGPGLPADAAGGGYHGPLAYRQGKPGHAPSRGVRCSGARAQVAPGHSHLLRSDVYPTALVASFTCLHAALRFRQRARWALTTGKVAGGGPRCESGRRSQLWRRLSASRRAC